MRRVLNVGGGSKAIPIPPIFDGWEHVLLDIDPSGNPDLVGDARDLIIQDPEQCDAIYCAHNLEHYYRHDTDLVLRGMRHILRPGGFCYIVVPDLWQAICEAADSQEGLETVMYQSAVGPITAMDMIFGHAGIVARGAHEAQTHKNGFSESTLQKALEAAGFERVKVHSAPERHELVAIGYREREN